MRTLLALVVLSPLAVAHADYTVISIKQAVANGGLQYWIDSATSNYPTSSFETLPPQGMYIQVLGKTRNVSNHPQTYTASYQTLTDKRSRVYAPSLRKIAEYSQTVININPGNEVVTPLYFDVPGGTSISDYWFTLRGSATSSGTSAWLCDPDSDTCGR